MKTFILLLFSSITVIHKTSNAQEITGGDYHSMFVCSDGSVMGCGYNLYGGLGNGSTAMVVTPSVLVANLTGITAVAGGNYFSLLLKNDGTAWACGRNDAAQLGDGTVTDRLTPIQVNSISGVISLSAGFQHSLFLKNDGTVWACGANSKGQLGDGTTNGRSTPVKVNGLSGIIAVAAGGWHSIFLKNDGTVWACGYNNNGQLGDGTLTNRTNAVQVNNLTDIIAISCGDYHSLFLKNDGTVLSCGDNSSGQLGDGTSTDRNSPVQIFGLTGVSGLKGSGTGNHSLFIKNDSTVWACGWNGKGQLGDGSNITRNTPVQVNNLTGISAVTGGYRHSIFLKNDGTVWACGDNSSGQLGDGTTTNSNNPILVNNLCNVTLNVSETYFNKNISIFPNPNNGKFYLLRETFQSTNIKIYNIIGEMVYESESINSEIDLSNQPAGIYSIEINSPERTFYKKIIIQ